MLGDLAGDGEGDLLVPAQVDPVDDAAAEIAAQVVGALAADGEDLDGLALAAQADGVGAGELGDVGVEAAAQAALGGHDDEQMHLVLAGADEQLRRGVAVGAPAEVAEHRIHALGIGARGGGRLLGAAQLGRGDHLHRLGDLPRRLDGGDAVAEVFQARHGPFSSSPSPRLRGEGRGEGQHTSDLECAAALTLTLSPRRRGVGRGDSTPRNSWRRCRARRPASSRCRR